MNNKSIFSNKAVKPSVYDIISSLVSSKDTGLKKYRIFISVLKKLSLGVIKENFCKTKGIKYILRNITDAFLLSKMLATFPQGNFKELKEACYKNKNKMLSLYKQIRNPNLTEKSRDHLFSCVSEKGELLKDNVILMWINILQDYIFNPLFSMRVISIFSQIYGIRIVPSKNGIPDEEAYEHLASIDMA
jgi:hypothetical protein